MCQSPEKPKESAVIFSVGLVALFFGTSAHVSLSILLAAIFIFSFIYPWKLVKNFFTLTFYFLISITFFVVWFAKVMNLKIFTFGSTDS